MLFVALRKFIQKRLPDVRKLRQQWYLRPFEAALRDPALWHINRRNTSRALAMGLFIGCIPLPGHTPLASVGAVYFRINLPVALAAVWVTNPVTIGPMFYFAYRLGAWLLVIPSHRFPDHFSFNWLFAVFAAIWKPLLLGFLIMGLTLAAIGYFSINLLWLISFRRRQARRRRYWQARKAEEN